MRNSIKTYASVVALLAALPATSAFAEGHLVSGDGGITLGTAGSVSTEFADPSRTIDQDPIDNIASPIYRYANGAPDSGSAGDVYNVTNIDKYETAVAGNVYAPVLSTENVNKLYVDNSLTYLANTLQTEIFNLRQDIQNMSVFVENVCMDLSAVKTHVGDITVDGETYVWKSALGSDCGSFTWNFDLDFLTMVENEAYNHGCSDAETEAGINYRYNGENQGHSEWSLTHDNPNDRAIMFKPIGWTDTDGDGRDDDGYAAYLAGYDAGYAACSPADEAPTVEWVEIQTPFQIEAVDYNEAKSSKRTGNDYRGPDNKPNRDWQVGDAAYYSGVGMTEDGISIDARITMTANDDDTWIAMAVNSHKDNVINVYGNGNDDWKEVDFMLELLDGGTGLPVSIRSALTTEDLDGHNAGEKNGFSEDVIFDKSEITGYSVVPGANVKLIDSNGRIKASGNALNDNGGSGETEVSEQWFTANFDGSSVKFSLSPRNGSSGFGFSGYVTHQASKITYPDGTVVYER